MTQGTVKSDGHGGVPPRGAAAAKILVAALLLFALFSVLPLLAVRGAGTFAVHAAATLGGGAKIAAEALSGLSDARVTPNFPLCAVCAAICAALIRKSRASAGGPARGLGVALTVFIAISASALSVWAGKINGVPVRVFLSILSDVLNSGLL